MTKNIAAKSLLLERVQRRVMGALTHVRTTTPVVALTFDDGPHPDYTPRLLDILARYQAQAPFFVLGENAARQRPLLERMAQEGHAIGNHTWDHPSFPLLDRRARWSQLRAWAKAVAPYGTKLFRPPYGNLTPAANLDTWLFGYRVVTWNVLGYDWLPEPVDALIERIGTRLTPGSIVLLHDALHNATSPEAFDRTTTLLAVERVLQQFQGHFHFVTVPALRQAGQPIYQKWERPPDVDWLNSLHAPREQIDTG